MRLIDSRGAIMLALCSVVCASCDEEPPTSDAGAIDAGTSGAGGGGEGPSDSGNADAAGDSGLDGSDGESGAGPMDAGDGGMPNRPPLANAGEYDVFEVGNEVTLDATNSTDPDGDFLTYHWTLEPPAGSATELSDREAAMPTFTIDRSGVYRATLVVNDGKTDSAPDVVLISTGDNLPPIANAGEDQPADVGALVELNGSGTDPNGDSITFVWTIVERPDGSQAELSDAEAMKPTFEVDVAGDYRFELVVSDGVLKSEPDEVLVSTSNVPPVAVIAALTDPVYVDQEIVLDASRSHDFDGDPITYAWSILSPTSPVSTLANETGEQATFTASRRSTPGQPYVLQLIVSDPQSASVPDTIAITTTNRVPVADAGADRLARAGDALQLDGRGSSDVDHDALTYAWQVVDEPSKGAGALADPTSDQPMLLVTEPGTYRVQLVVSDGELASPPDDVEITVDRGSPRILGFTPTSTSWGTLVEISGRSFMPPSGAPRVLLRDRNGDPLEAPVARFDDDSITVVVPAGAATSTITVQLPDENAETDDELEIVPSSDFELVAVPPNVRLMPGHSAAYVVRLESRNGFPLLAELRVEGLPSDITGELKPQRIAAGQWALLTLSASATTAPSTLGFQVHASATVDGIAIERSVNLVTEVLPQSTAFVGRAVRDDQAQTPLAGVTVRLLPRDGNGGVKNCSGETTSDAAGNFLFVNLPQGCEGSQMIRYDGLTVVDPVGGDYAGVDLHYDIIPGQVTSSPTLIHLPRIDDAETVMVHQNHGSDQTFTFATIPDLTVTVYAGTTLTMPDSSTPNPFPLVAVSVPVDRLPDEVPTSNVGFHYFIVAFQPANAMASQPVAVSFPNQMQQTPGTVSPLMTLDPTRGVMVQYGTGRVSSNGRQIVPDLDPAHPGHRYGLVHFDWHGAFSTAANASNPGGCTPRKGEPIDLSTGITEVRHADIEIVGARGRIGIDRNYRTMTTNVGPFGIGTGHNYTWQLTTSVPSLSPAFELIYSDGGRALFSQDTDGAWRNANVPWLQGAVFRRGSGETSELHWRDGTTYVFSPYSFVIGSLLTQIIDPDRNAITIVRDSARPFRITEVVDPVGRRLLLTYDGNDRITRITDPIGRSVSYTYNAAGLLETFTNAAGGVWRYEYDDQNRLWREIDPRGIRIAQNTYDDNDRVIRQVLASDAELLFEYTLVNPGVGTSPVLQTVFTDGRGNVETYRFNPQGYLLSATDGLGQTRVYEHAPGTNQVVAEHGTGACESCGTATGDQFYSYDARGNNVRFGDALGETVTTYNDNNDPVTVTDALGNTTIYGYNIQGQVVSVVDANSHDTRYEYGPGGLVTRIIDALGNEATRDYDGFGNLIARTDPLGNTTRYRYDAVSRLVEIRDAMGRTTTLDHDSLDRVIATTDGRGYTARYEYDAIGNQTAVVDARNDRTEFAYDDGRRQVLRRDPLGREEIWEHDAVGNLTQHTDRRGVTASFVYDDANRLVYEQHDDGSSPAAVVSRTYDSLGMLAQVTDNEGGDYSFEYDVRGALVRSVAPNGTIDYQRDALGRAEWRQVLGQERVDYDYDDVGNLVSTTTPEMSVVLAYDELDRLVTETRGNGVVSTHGYDAAGRLTFTTYDGPGGAVDQQRYEYDASGKEIRFTGALAQPLQTQAVVRANYGLGNRIESWADRTYTHDSNGNRASETTPAGVTTYLWDARSRLKSLHLASGAEFDLTYSFSGGLVAVRSMGAQDLYLEDDVANVAWHMTASGIAEHAVDGRVIDRQFGVTRPMTGAQYALTSLPANTTAITDGSGNVTQTFSYEPYGELHSSGEYPFQYGGRVRVGPLYNLRARYYDPVTAAFLSEDPLYDGTGTTHRYADNDPIGNTDPWGLTATAAAPFCPVPIVEAGAAERRTKYQCTAKVHCKAYAGPNPGNTREVFGQSAINCAEATRDAKRKCRLGEEHPRHPRCWDSDGFTGIGEQCEQHIR